MADELIIHIKADGAEQTQASIQKVSGSLKAAHEDTLKLGAAIGVASSAATAGFGAIANLAQAGLGALKSAAIDTNSSLEQANIAFTTMLGSAEKSAAFLKDMQVFAAQTPFKFPELVEASKRMLAFGFAAEQIKPTLTAVGNAVAAMGSGQEGIDRVTRALGQMQAKTKVQAEEMLQLTEAGIPAWDFLAKKLGTDVSTAMDMVTKRLVDANTFLEAFTEGTAARFGNMMEAQSHTFAGAMSTIQDTLGMTIAALTGPFFQALARGADQLAQFLQTDAVAAWQAEMTAAFQQAFDTLGAFVGRVQYLWENTEPVFSRLGDIMGAAGHAVDLFVQQGIVGFDRLTGRTVDYSDQSLTSLQRLIAFLHDDLIPAVNAVSEVVSAGFVTAMDAMVAAQDAVIPKLQELHAWLADNLPPALEAAQAKWDEFWSQAGAEIATTWELAAPVLAQLKDWLGEQIPRVLQELRGQFDFWLNGIRTVFEGLGRLLGPIAEVWGGEARAWNRALQEGLKAMAPDTEKAAREMSEKLQGQLGLTADEAEAAGQTIGADTLKGVVAGFAQESPAVQEAIRANVRAMVEAAKQQAEIGSPSELMADEVGAPLAEGVAVGVEQAAPAAASRVSRAMGTIAKAAAGGVSGWRGYTGVVGDPVVDAMIGRMNATMGGTVPAGFLSRSVPVGGGGVSGLDISAAWDAEQQRIGAWYSAQVMAGHPALLGAGGDEDALGAMLSGASGGSRGGGGGGRVGHRGVGPGQIVDLGGGATWIADALGDFTAGSGLAQSAASVAVRPSLFGPSGAPATNAELAQNIARAQAAAQDLAEDTGRAWKQAIATAAVLRTGGGGVNLFGGTQPTTSSIAFRPPTNTQASYGGMQTGGYTGASTNDVALAWATSQMNAGGPFADYWRTVVGNLSGGPPTTYVINAQVGGDVLPLSTTERRARIDDLADEIVTSLRNRGASV